MIKTDAPPVVVMTTLGGAFALTGKQVLVDHHWQDQFPPSRNRSIVP